MEEFGPEGVSASENPNPQMGACKVPVLRGLPQGRRRPPEMSLTYLSWGRSVSELRDGAALRRAGCATPASARCVFQEPGPWSPALPARPPLRSTPGTRCLRRRDY